MVHIYVPFILSKIVALLRESYTLVYRHSLIVFVYLDLVIASVSNLFIHVSDRVACEYSRLSFAPTTTCET